MAGKGSKPRPVKFKQYQENMERIFPRVTDEDEPKGTKRDGHECLGCGAWHTIDQRCDDLRETD